MSAQAPDIQAVAADAERRLAELREKRQLLSLPAIEDPDGPEAKELTRVEGEIASIGSQLQRAQLATHEQARRETETREAEERKVREAARQQVQKLQPQVQRGLAAIDAQLAALAGEVKAQKALTDRLAQELRAAGEGPGRTASRRDWAEERRLTSALRFHFDRAGVSDAIADVPPQMRGHSQPLVSGEEAS
jgi:hypothetical protein